MQPDVEYEHTQEAPRWLIVLASVAAIAIFAVVAGLARTGEGGRGLTLFATLWIGLIYLAVLSATRLTTRVTPATIELQWRLGWPTKRIDRATVVSAAAHRNTWIAGWGIRKVVRGSMWNVAGFDAVQLELDNGRVFRIGTDDVAGLLAALGR